MRLWSLYHVENTNDFSYIKKACSARATVWLTNKAVANVDWINSILQCGMHVFEGATKRDSLDLSHPYPCPRHFGVVTNPMTEPYLDADDVVSVSSEGLESLRQRSHTQSVSSLRRVPSLEARSLQRNGWWNLWGISEYGSDLLENNGAVARDHVSAHIPLNQTRG